MATQPEPGELYSVEFALNVAGDGFTVLCCFPDPKQASIRVGDAVEFVRPDKRLVRTTVRKVSIAADGRPGLIRLVLPKGLDREEVPPRSMLRLVPR